MEQLFEVIYQGNGQPIIELVRGTSLSFYQIHHVFISALWKFESKNKLIFINRLLPKLFPLIINYTKFGNIYKFRSENILDFEQVFFDGIIRSEEAFLILDGIYALSTVNEPLQIARVIQKLEPTGLSGKEFEEHSQQVRHNYLKLNDNLANEKVKLDKFEIEPWEVIKKYNISLQDDTEFNNFELQEAILFISYPPQSDRPIDIQLISKLDSGLQPGNISWHCQPQAEIIDKNWYFINHAKDSNCDLINIHIDLEYLDKLPTNKCVWFDKRDDNRIISILGKKIAVNLTFQGDRVTGNIRASGYYLDTLEPKIYQVTLVGEIEKSKEVELLRQAISNDNSDFTGCWITKLPLIEKIKLQQDNNLVQGTYYANNHLLAGNIAGIVVGNCLEFNWVDDAATGWGYLRSLNKGGVLFGMWVTSELPHEPQMIVADWQLPIDIKNASRNDEIFLRDLRYLGHELIIAKQYEQGLAILEQVLALYRHQRQQLDSLEGDRWYYLNDEVLTLVAYILRSNVYLGNYRKLINNLEHLIELIQLLSAEESASRLFNERTIAIDEGIVNFLESCTIFRQSLTNNNFLLANESERGLVGIYISNIKDKDQVIIDKIIPNSPAESVGILPGDVLIKVGDTDVKDLAAHEVYSLLAGEPSSAIDIVIQRKNETIKVSLNRVLTQVYPAQRQAELLDIFNYIERYFIDLINLSESELDDLASLKLNIIKGKIDFLEAWIVLSNNMTSLEDKLDNNIGKLLTIKEQLFSEYPDFIEVVNLLIYFIDKTTNNLISHENINYQIEDINPLELDQKITSFTSKRSPVEAMLFRVYLSSLPVINGFSSLINFQHSFMSKVDIVKYYADTLQTSKTMLSNITYYIERWRSKLVEDLEKIEALQLAQPLFTKVLEMSVVLGDVRQALIVSEQSRSRAFADLLATRFNENINEDFINFPITSPEITVEEIQQIAKTNSATIVEYFVSVFSPSIAKIYVWVVQPNGSIILKTIELKDDLQQDNYVLLDLIIKTRESLGARHSETFINNLDSFCINSLNFTDSQKLLIELYQLLIEPIESYINTSSTNKVILIPHNALFLIPFATLLNPKTNKYLIEQYSIILSPSLQTLNLTQQNFVNDTQANNILVVGNPHKPYVGSPAKLLPQLPYAEIAAKAISNLFQTQPLLGKQATKSAILAQLPYAKIIHFGTHGQLNDVQPLQSGIALTPEVEAGGLLTVTDILARFAPPQTKSLNAELVVLCACSTGLGKITGDGVIGLSRGLMAAGVKAVLVSLWEVQDFPTACLMVQFYQYFQADNNPTQALRKAQVWLKNLTNQELKSWMRREKLPLNSMEESRVVNWLRQQQLQGNLYPFQHPYYWGAFYIIGA